MSQRGYWIDMELSVVEDGGMFRHRVLERDEGMITVAYEEHEDKQWVQKSEVTVSVDRADALADQIKKMAAHLREQDVATFFGP